MHNQFPNQREHRAEAVEPKEAHKSQSQRSGKNDGSYIHVIVLGIIVAIFIVIGLAMAIIVNNLRHH